MYKIKTIRKYCDSPSEYKGFTTGNEQVEIRVRNGSLIVELGGKTLLFKATGQTNSILTLEQIKEQTKELLSF